MTSKRRYSNRCIHVGYCIIDEVYCLFNYLGRVFKGFGFNHDRGFSARSWVVVCMAEDLVVTKDRRLSASRHERLRRRCDRSRPSR